MKSVAIVDLVGVMTYLRCSLKSVANLLSRTVKLYLKLANISQSYKGISSGTFFTDHGVNFVYFPGL